MPIAAPPKASPLVEPIPAKKPAQQSAQAPAALQPHENGNDVAHSRQPAVPSAAEQQRVCELEQRLREVEGQKADETRRLQQALSDREGSLQVLQSQQAAAKETAASMRQELAQQEAEKAELRQQLYHLEAQQRAHLETQGKELTSLNRSLQGQVQTLSSTQ